MYKIDLEQTLKFIMHFEGCVLRAYQDAVGVWTIGYGHTEGVKKGQVITDEKAMDMLGQDVVKVLEQINKQIAKEVAAKLTEAQMTALVSFVFNLGIGAFGKSTLLKKLNEGLIEEAGDEFLKWDKARVCGVLKPLPGLTRRRKAERNLWMRGYVSA